MQVTKQKQVKTVETEVYTFTMDREEFELFLEGLGKTSSHSREEAGMNPDEATFFFHLYTTAYKEYVRRAS